MAIAEREHSTANAARGHSTASRGQRSYCLQQRVGSSPACSRGREGGRAGRSGLDQGVAAGTEVWRMGRGVADGTKRGDLDRGVTDRTTRGGQDEGVANWIAAWRMGRGRGGRHEGVADRTTAATKQPTTETSPLIASQNRKGKLDAVLGEGPELDELSPRSTRGPAVEFRCFSEYSI